MTGRPPRPAKERFVAKVVRVEKADACWEFTGSIGRDGYGQFRSNRGGSGMEKAHRYAWFLENGDIPEGLFVLHRCDNRKCVRPSHLWLGTLSDNMKDMVAKGRNPDISGSNNPMYGKFGEMNPAYGKANGPLFHTEETKRKMSVAQLKRYENERA